MNRSLYRCRENRVLAGVAAGVAEFFGLDPTLVRVLWFISILFGGLGIVVYIGLALIVPLEPESTTDETHVATAPAGHRHASANRGRVGMIIGFGLILLGALALLQVVLPDWISWRQLWPLLILGIGAVLVTVSFRRRQATG